MNNIQAAPRDRSGRKIDYLRISVTDRCNMRCIYCMPEDGVPLIPHEEVLRHEEIVSIVRAASGLGISRVRLTGGEPLLRRGIISLTEMIARVPGISDLAMTTNGALLKAFAPGLAAAGLKRINISLDTLRPERFRLITRRNSLAPVLDGIEAAERAGLSPVKINTVVMRSLNLDEIGDFVNLARLRSWHIRFIELMPSWGGAALLDRTEVVPAEEIAGMLKDLGAIEVGSDRGPRGAGPARYFKFPDAKGTVGLIGSEDGDPRGMCARCNRLRLSADGKLYSCLFTTRSVDLRQLIRSGATPGDITEAILQAIRNKPGSGREGYDEAGYIGAGAAGIETPGRHTRPALSEIGG